MYIDFDSYKEFCALLGDLVSSHTSLALALAKDPILITHPHKKDAVMRNFVVDSSELWYKFTKGQQLWWCNAQCNALAFMLVNTKILYETKCFEVAFNQNNTEKEINLESILHSMVLCFFEACPSIDFPVVFTCNLLADAYTSIQQDVEDDSFEFLMKDKYEALWLDDYFIPIKKYQEYQLALAMGTHYRLGRDSVCFDSNTDILKMIWRFIGSQC